MSADFRSSIPRIYVAIAAFAAASVAIHIKQMSTN